MSVAEGGREFDGFAKPGFTFFQAAEQEKKPGTGQEGIRLGMAGGSFHAPTFALSWPTGEFGGMGLEGAVKLGYRKELEAITDPAERRALFDKMVAAAYARGKALSTATYFEVDEVIDPADSRRWVATALLGAASRPRNEHKKRSNIDTW